MQNHKEALSDPQALARNMLVKVDHPTAGETKTLGVHIKLSDTPGAIRRPAPRHGEHTEEILAELTNRKAAE